MENSDTILTALDAEIEELESVAHRIEGELQRVREMRKWWAERQPVIPLGEVVAETDETRPVEVIRGGTTLKDYVVKVLEGSNSALTVPEIRDHAWKLGWRTKSDHKSTMVRTRLGQLQEAGVVERVGNQRWRIAKNPVAARWQQLDTSPENEPEVEAQPTLPGPGG